MSQTNFAIFAKSLKRAIELIPQYNDPIVDVYEDNITICVHGPTERGSNIGYEITSTENFQFSCEVYDDASPVDGSPCQHIFHRYGELLNWIISDIHFRLV